MKKYIPFFLALAASLIFPCILEAQQTGGVQKLHDVLDNLYESMIPLCAKLTGVAQLVGSFGALWYIGYRVFKHISNAEAIDFFPLFKPFVLALVISFYPAVLKVFRGILKPLELSTGALVKETNEGVQRMLVARAKSITSSEEWESMMGGLDQDQKDWHKYQQPEEENKEKPGFGMSMLFSFNIFRNVMEFIVKGIVSALLQILYYAAALCIDTLRTFHLVILAILGPFVLCLSMFDGFGHSLPVWLGRYINVYLWLPIANLFGSLINQIQIGMLQTDISQQHDLIGFGPTDIAYLIFLFIAIVGYFTIPSIANYVIHASGANALLSKTNSLIMSGASMAAGGFAGGAKGAGAAGGAGGSMAGDIMGMDKKMYPMSDAANSEPYLKDPASSYQQNQLSGRT